MWIKYKLSNLSDTFLYSEGMVVFQFYYCFRSGSKFLYWVLGTGLESPVGSLIGIIKNILDFVGLINWNKSTQINQHETTLLSKSDVLLGVCD